MWITVDVERALYVDRGRNVILCELMPGHQTLVLKLKGGEMTDELQRLRSALENIADWRNVNISGEYEHGLRDIIRSIVDCAVAALESPRSAGSEMFGLLAAGSFCRHCGLQGGHDRMCQMASTFGDTEADREEKEDAQRLHMRQSAGIASQPRFFIDHGMIHDRLTGKHVTTEPDSAFCDGVAKCCDLLNSLAERREPRVFPLLFDSNWLEDKIKADPDLECEAGPDLSRDEPQPTRMQPESEGPYVGEGPGAARKP
ncbi:hypothetical protein ACVWZK_006456 [Bradyrhizobium sp. GM0.4]